jgi:hypothetical protein
MRRYGWVLAVTALLLAAGFAAASIANGGGLRLLKTGTTSTVPKKQTICHRTHSKKHPTVTITVSSSAVPAHLKHGDTLGACTKAPVTHAPKKNSNSGAPHGNSANNHGK